ncbi:MAG: ATP-dependent DNA helicase [bacterium]
MSIDKFLPLYKKLNPEQKKAVDTIEGPVMVIAGPGTGKTQVLTLRISNILRKTDASPESILALTFTESAAISMRRRLADIIGSSAYSVVIKTFHGFCNDVIKERPENFPRIAGATNIAEVDQLNVLKEIINSLPLEHLKPFGESLLYLRSVLSSINQLKREGVSPNLFSEIAKKELKAFKHIKNLIYEKGRYKGQMRGVYQKQQKQILKNCELAEIYRKYQESLENANLYDYNDMIMEVLEAVKENKELLLSLQEQHQYILVDEHQDTNNSQNKILEKLASFHPDPNIFLVGDEKQAIFRFQGASLENFHYFQNLYKKAVLINLKKNYRSTDNILHSADSLISGPEEMESSAGDPGEKIVLYSFSQPLAEAYFLAEDIKGKIKQGTKPEEIAVLYRDNKDIFRFLGILEKSGIPFSIESDQNILNDPDIKKLILLFKTIKEFGLEERFVEALHIDFLEIDPLDVYKIIDFSNRNRVSVFELVSSKKTMKSLSFVSSDQINSFYNKISSWVTVSKNKSFADFFGIVVRESGLLSYILRQGDFLERINRVNNLFDEAKLLIEKHRNYGLKEFLDYLEMLEKENILVSRKPLSRLADRVRLMTVHRAKGLEFTHVYIIDCRNGHWGNRKYGDPLPLLPAVFSLSGGKIEERNSNDDERRLFYVALTRAKKTVTISYSREGENGREQLPSQFIREIKPEFISEKDGGQYEKELVANKEIFFAPVTALPLDMKNKKFVRKLFLQRGLSATALNNYIECPWKYFYMNLIRIPKAKTKHQMYGTAVHETLKDFFDAFKEMEPDKNFLLDKFTYYLNRQELATRDFKQTLAKGKASLSGYYDIYKGTWKPSVVNEFVVKGIMLTPEIRLTGKIDKIELLNQGGGVNVVDYKTGRPKSRREIEGITKNSRGDIKRQLVFYRLLLDNYPKLKYKMLFAEIDFVEPDAKGRYKKESFEISRAEVNDLEKLIKKTVKEITSVSFWNKRCENKDCEFCRLRKMIAD